MYMLEMNIWDLKTISFTIKLKSMKYFTKYVQRPYAENDRTLMKEMKHVYK